MIKSFKFLYTLLLFCISVLCFVLSFPNPVFVHGIPLLSFFVLTPIIILLSYLNYKTTILIGALYGVFVYALFNYWLFTFHPVSSLLVLSITALYFCFLFPVMKMALLSSKKWGWIFASGIFLLYEWLRTLGFLGYPYGILGYALSPIPNIIQSAQITGVFGVSFIVGTIGSYLGFIILQIYKKTLSFKNVLFQNITILALLLYLILPYFFINVEPYNTLKVTLVQRNMDPRLQNQVLYEKAVDLQIELSKQGIQDNTDIVIWPETSIIPSIFWHEKYKHNADTLKMIERFRFFMQNTKANYFLIGNADKTTIETKNGPTYQDFNTALLFYKGNFISKYSKIKLVPFTEYFPFDNLDFIKNELSKFASFWTPGTSYTVFDIGKAKIAVVICFEDLFGSHVRKFVQKEATLIATLTDDAWSQSEPCERQHLACSVFRAVENQLPAIRSTNSGITCIISPQGHIQNEIERGKQGFLTGSVHIPQNHKQTIYTKYGDFFPIILGIFIGCYSIIKHLKLGMKKIK